MHLNYIASVLFGAVAIVLLFAFAVYFHRPNVAYLAVMVAASAWVSCWLGAAGQYMQNDGSNTTAGLLGILSLAMTAVAVMFFVFALTRIA